MKGLVRNIVLIVCGCLLAGCIVLAVTAGTSSRKVMVCSGVDIVIADSLENSFVTKADIKGFLDKEYGRYTGVVLDSIDLQKEVVMAYVAYAQTPPYAESFIDRDGKVYSATQVGFFDTIDEGNAMMSNHNCNKGVFNRTYNSTVSVYSYDASGKLLDAKSYWVEDPDSAIPADGTKLKALSSDAVFTIGKAMNADGSYTETVLTNYQGTYVALAKSMRHISDHLIGLVKYFDAQ